MNITTDALILLSTQDLLEILITRSRSPRTHEPWPDDRRNEHPLEIFVQCAMDDISGQLDVKLQNAISSFFESSSSNDLEDPATEGLIILSQHRAIAGVAPSLRSWLLRNRDALAKTFPDLGNEAIETMASFASSKQQHWRDFFMELWRHCPDQWTPSVFKAVQRVDLASACRLLSELIQRASHAHADVADLILGVWKQDNGRALLKWLRTDASFDREPIIALISPHLRISEHRELRADNSRIFTNQIFSNAKPNGIMARSGLRVVQEEEV